MVGRGCEDLMGFRRREGPDRFAVDGCNVHGNRDIAHDQSPFHRDRQSCTEGGVDVLHCPRREPLVGFGVDQLLDVCGGELRQADVAKGGLNVTTDVNFVADPGSALARRLDDLVEPSVEKLADSDLRIRKRRLTMSELERLPQLLRHLCACRAVERTPYALSFDPSEIDSRFPPAVITLSDHSFAMTPTGPRRFAAIHVGGHGPLPSQGMASKVPTGCDDSPARPLLATSDDGHHDGRRPPAIHDVASSPLCRWARLQAGTASRAAVILSHLRSGDQPTQPELLPVSAGRYPALPTEGCPSPAVRTAWSG